MNFCLTADDIGPTRISRSLAGKTWHSGRLAIHMGGRSVGEISTYGRATWYGKILGDFMPSGVEVENSTGVTKVDQYFWPGPWSRLSVQLCVPQLSLSQL